MRKDFIFLAALILLAGYSLGFSGGSGTPDDPYQISDCLELNETRKYPSSDFILKNDIDCGDTDNWDYGFPPIGSDSDPFEGNFNGDGYDVLYLYIDSSDDYVGLFGYIDGSSRGSINITNLDVYDADIRGAGCVGGIAGWADYVNFYGCDVSGQIWSDGTGSQLYGTGGLVGNSDYELTVESCSSDADIISDDNAEAGGLVGYFNTGNITDSYASSDVEIYSTGSEVGCLVGRMGDSDGLVKNSYGDCYDVNGIGNVGGLVGLCSGTIVECFSETSTVNGSTGSGAGGFVGELGSDGNITNCYSESEVSGDGEVGGFVGDNQGIIEFSYATGDVTGPDETGGFAGVNSLGGTIINSFSVGQVSEVSRYGGFVGNQLGTITGCYWNNVSGNSDDCYDGGNTGCKAIQDNSNYFYYKYHMPMNNWDFEDAWGQQQSDYPEIRYFGGGDSSYSGSGSEGSPYQVGYCSQLQEMKESLTSYYEVQNDIDCSDSINWNYGKGFEPVGTSGSSFTGTLNGRNYTVSGLHINRSSTDYVGLIGHSSGGSDIYDLLVTDVNISGGDATGGVVGQVNANITHVFSNGSVTGLLYVGGITGYTVEGSIERCSSGANVNGSARVGGLIGYNSGTNVSDSKSSGNVNVGGDDAGGLVGYSIRGNITDCFATGDISGNQDVGGLLGYASMLIVSNSFSTGNSVGGGLFIGSLVGYNSGSTILNSYWNNHAGNPSSCYDGGDTGCTAIQDEADYFKHDVYPDYAPMASWDFSSKWQEMQNDFPELRGFGPAPEEYVDIDFNASYPASPEENEDTIIYANVSGINVDIEWVNFTVEAPNASVMMDHENASARGNARWNSSIFYPNAVGTWSWNVTAKGGSSTDITSGSFTISAWHIITGNLFGTFSLQDSGANAYLSNWTVEDNTGSNIYVADSDSSISFSNLKALSRNSSGTYSKHDFEYADNLLNMSSLDDSINSTFTDGGNARDTATFNIFKATISDVAIVNSTNSSSFITGILWDASDDDDESFDEVDNEDLVFITKTNYSTAGLYGVYDYEIKVPANLRKYKGTDYSSVSIYAEVK